MKNLIKGLAKGIRPAILNQKMTHPDLARERLIAADKLMKEASLLLTEANTIILGFAYEGTTFDHRYRALKWAQLNNQDQKQ